MTHGSTFLWILGSCGEIFYDLFIRVISMLVSTLTLPFVVGPSHGSLFLSSVYLLPIHHDVIFQEMLRSWGSFFGNTEGKENDDSLFGDHI